ncbi:MAG: low molecular weight phosphotyrosine protein phosphatase, partial [Deinococcales bacterium]|nr:low molecular weight phosphotyrosine protein phosphatase [Chitinophagaceae bacterium]
MICLGNICRSPLAEGILLHKANACHLNILVDSAGTANYNVGKGPHDLSQKVAKLNGINISNQKCRQFKKTDFEVFDKIYVMDISNYNDVKELAGNYFNEHKIDLILNELYPNQNIEVPDPWYGGFEDFKKVYAMLDEACEV